MLLETFLKEFQSPGYSLPETLFYSLVLVFSLYFIFKVFTRLKISFDRNFAVAIAPYIVFGSLLRVTRDLDFLPFAIFVTPWIYLFVFSLFIASLTFSLFIQKKFKIWLYKPLFLIGILILTFPLSLLTFAGVINFKGILLVLAFFLPWVVLFKLIKWKVENKLTTLLQLFDGTTTATAINFFGYQEQHWLPTIIIFTFHPFSFVLVKLLAVVSILIFIDKFCKERDLRNFIKLIIATLGAATGIRDFTCLATFCVPH
jgi:uncharacterized membrane protein